MHMPMQARLHLDEIEMRHCVRRLPALLGYSHEANIVPKLDQLQAHPMHCTCTAHALHTALHVHCTHTACALHVH